MIRNVPAKSVLAGIASSMAMISLAVGLEAYSSAVPASLRASHAETLAAVKRLEALAVNPAWEYGPVFDRLPEEEREAILELAPTYENSLRFARAHEAVVAGELQRSIPHLALVLEGAARELLEGQEFRPHELRDAEDHALRALTLASASLDIGARTLTPAQADRALAVAMSLGIPDADLTNLYFAANDTDALVRQANQDASALTAAQALLQLGRSSGDAGVLREAADRFRSIRAEWEPSDSESIAYLALKEGEARVRAVADPSAVPRLVEEVEALLETAALATDALEHPFLHRFRCSVELGMVVRLLPTVRRDDLSTRNRFAGRRDAADACALTGVSI